nr:unnamed protein product [Trichobilharzia regenti]CAH8819885.1 unnamed protein product [Trichobilharzia regenti]CAH8868468.1 unnamed protein product [Trichobilharzia regenti]CAH8868522.1 unnamed protein product [Trichobilharzia regenti]
MKSGIVAAVGLTLLLSLSSMSLVSFIAYIGIAIMCCTTACKLYGFITRQFKSNQDSPKNPFEFWLELEMTLPGEKIGERVAALCEKLSEKLNYLRRVLWLEDYFETVKLVVCLYLLSVVGAWFNLLTLITIAFVLGMTCPKIYLLCKPQFDAAFQTTKEKIFSMLKFAEAKVSGLRGKPSTE